MTPLCALAQETATIDGIRYYLAGGEATVMAQTEQLKGDIIIPETVNYEGAVFTVTSLSHSAFKDQGHPPVTGYAESEQAYSKPVCGYALQGK